MERKLPPTHHATARANAVQGLLCAHGYRDRTARTLPVTSLFVSIDSLHATVDFQFDPDSNAEPVVALGYQPLSNDWFNRITAFTTTLLNAYGFVGSYRIFIDQNFPSGIGVGSSAAVYAALTLSVTSALRLEVTQDRLSSMARRGSYSAAAAITGHVSAVSTAKSSTANFGKIVCRNVDFPYKLVVLPVAGEKKSEEIHEDIISSPFYDQWLQAAKRLSAHLRELIRGDKFDEIGKAVESYVYLNYATISTGRRNLMPWAPETLSLLSRLRNAREKKNLDFFISMNSGPAIFLYFKPREERKLLVALETLKVEYIISDIGGSATRLT